MPAASRFGANVAKPWSVRNNPPQASLTSILLAAAVAVPACLLLLTAWLNYRQAERDAFEAAEYTAAALTEHALRTFRSHELVIDFVAGHIAGMTWAEISSSARLHRLLHDVAQRNDDIDTVVVVAPDGTAAISSRIFPTPPLDASDRDYFARLLEGEGLFISRPAIGRLTGERFFSVARPLRDDQGGFNGVVAVAVNPMYFERFYQSLLRPSQAASLVRADGVVLVRQPRVEQVVHVLPEDSELMQALRRAPGSGTLAARSSTDGMQRIFAFNRVDRYPVYATFQLARASIWSQWRAAMLPFLLASLLAFIALAAAAGLARQRAGRALAEQHRRDAEEASRAKDRFVATLSHEIRNPLSAIAAASELMRRSPESAGMATTVITRQVTQLRGILDDVLDTARTMLGKLNLDKRLLDLGELAGEIVAERAARHRGGIDFHFFGAGAWVEADAVRLRQIIDNLLENAVRYGARRITVTVARSAQCHDLVVQDDGQGISAELLPRLFEPFAQGKHPPEQAGGGLGVGLALASHLAKLHRGSLRVSSEGPGRGSRFTLSLPIAQPPARPVAARLQPARGARRRIVLVDDEPDARATLGELLARSGNEVIAAGSGTEGLAAIEREQPDVALLDIGLPDMDGFELARRARAAQGESPLLLIAITGYGQPHDRERAASAGFDAHLTKPFSYDELLGLIEQLSVAHAPS